MQKPKVSVIIVNYNTKKYIGECLSSLSGDFKDADGEVIVVDNASKDGSVEYIKNNFPQVKVVKNNKNLGFAKAANQGAKIAKGNFLLFLNPDTKVLKGSISNLLFEAEKRKDVAVFAPKILNPDGSSQNSVRNFPTIWRAVDEYFLGNKGVFNGFSPDLESPTEVEAVVGACMLIPKNIFEKLGVFDERYFLYYEDLDFCRKAKKAGHKIIFVPQAKVIHEVGGAGRWEESRTYHYLKDSSRIYHGSMVSFFINLILFLGQKWQKNFSKKI